MSTTDQSDQFTSFTLDNAWNVEFPTRHEGVLRLGPGPLILSARLSVRHRGADNWYTIVDADVRLADRDGELWQATATFHANQLLSWLIDLSRKQPTRWLRHWPARWRQAREKHCLIEGLTTTQDDRFSRCVWIDGSAIPFHFKYFGAAFAVAVLSGDQLLVSVEEMWGTWNHLPLEGLDGAPLAVPLPRPSLSEEEQGAENDRLCEAGEEGHVDEMQPMGYEIEAGRLFFCNDVSLQGDDWHGWGASRPLVFSRIGVRGEAQQAVSFLPGLHPTPLVGIEVAGDEEFVQVAQVNWSGSYRLLTNAGGWLHVEGGETWSVRLERALGSEREPVDVLRWRSRLTDTAGDVWEGVSLFTPDVFLRHLIDLDRIDFTVSPQSEEWPTGPGLRGIRGLVDDGAWRYLFLPTEAIAFQGVGQKLTIDVHLAGAKVEVRISGLEGRRRPITIERQDSYFVTLDPPERAEETKQWEQDQPLPALVYEMSFTQLAFHNTTFAVDDGFWHQNPVPIPVVFRRVGKAAPAEGVQFRPGME